MVQFVSNDHKWWQGWGGESYDTIYQRMSLVCYHSVIYGRTVEFLGPVTHLPKNHSLIPFFMVLCYIMVDKHCSIPRNHLIDKK